MTIDQAQLEELRERAFERAARPGHLRVFGGGEHSFREILKLVEHARESIEIRAFLWRDDECGNRLGEAVLRAANRGVKVTIQKDRIAAVYEYTGGNKQSFFHKRVKPVHGFQAWFLSTVYNSKGSFRQRPNLLAEDILDHPNIQVSHKRNRFDHSKVFVFDGEILVLGSMGIGDNHHTDWVDVMVEVRGAEHVDRLRRRMAGELDFDPKRHIDFLVHSREAHAPKTCPMVDERLSLINSAQHSVTAEMAYLGDKRFTAALIKAVQRGCRVLLITSNADVLGNVNLATCDLIRRKTGAPEHLTVCIMPRVVHSKFVVVDGRFSDIGSANFTRLSHGVYEEINVYVDDEDFAQRLEDVARAHCTSEGKIVEDRLSYGKFAAQVERAIMAYQSRKGG